MKTQSDLTGEDYLKSIWASLHRTEGRKPQMAFTLEADDVLGEQLNAILVAIVGLRDAVLALPAPVVNVPQLAPPTVVVEPPTVVVEPSPVDLGEIVRAVSTLGTGMSPDAIADAITARLLPSAPDQSNQLAEVATGLKEIAWRMKGMGTQAYGGGAVSFSESGVNQFRSLFAEFMPDLTGTWAYYAGVSGTVNVTAGQRVVGIAAFSTAGGTVAINGGSAIPIAAGTGWQLSPTGQLVAPTIVFTGTSSYTVETLA